MAGGDAIAAGARGASAEDVGRGVAAGSASAALVPVALPPVAADSKLAVELSESQLAAFPEGRLDESAQPLDLSKENSWSRRLGQVSTGELLHTMAANAVAPFVLCGRLRPALVPPRRRKTSKEAVDGAAREEAAEGDAEEEGGTKAEIRARSVG